MKSKNNIRTYEHGNNTKIKNKLNALKGYFLFLKCQFFENLGHNSVS